MSARPTGRASSSGDGTRSRPPEQEVPGIATAGGRLLVGVRVSPSSSRVALRGLYGERLKVSLTAPPEDNRANRQLEESLAAWLDLPGSQVSVDSGNASRDKMVAFAGISETELRRRLARLLARADRMK